MFLGPLFGLLSTLLLVAAGVAIVLWVRRSRAGVAAGEEPQGLGQERPRGRISLLTEAIGYIGAILVLAGGAVGIGQRWAEFSKPTRLAMLGAAALVFLAIGALTRSSTEPAFQRLTSVTWAMSVAAFAGTAAVVNQFYDTEPETAFLTIATSSTAYAILLWALNRHAIQHAVMFAGLLVSVASILTRVIHEPAPWIIATAIWAIAVLWVALGWTRRVSPWWMALPLGLVVALIAPAAMDNDPARFALGIGTAGCVMALSVAAKFTPGLAIGAVGMLGYVVGVVTHYFSGTIGVPAALAITGLLILVLGALTARLFRFTARGPRQGDEGTQGARPAGGRKAA